MLSQINQISDEKTGFCGRENQKQFGCDADNCFYYLHLLLLRKSPCSVDVIEDEISSVTPTQQSKLRGRQSDRKKEREIMLRGRKEERASDREIKQRGRGEVRAVSVE